MQVHPAAHAEVAGQQHDRFDAGAPRRAQPGDQIQPVAIRQLPGDDKKLILGRGNRTQGFLGRKRVIHRAAAKMPDTLLQDAPIQIAAINEKDTHGNLRN